MIRTGRKQVERASIATGMEFNSVMEGELEKRGGTLTFVSKKYYVVLKDAKLSYYRERNKPGSISGSIDISKVQSVRSSSQKFSFEIVAGSSSTVFMAPTAELRDQWVKALQESMSVVSRRSHSSAIWHTDFSVIGEDPISLEGVDERKDEISTTNNNNNNVVSSTTSDVVRIGPGDRNQTLTNSSTVDSTAITTHSDSNHHVLGSKPESANESDENRGNGVNSNGVVCGEVEQTTRDDVQAQDAKLNLESQQSVRHINDPIPATAAERKHDSYSSGYSSNEPIATPPEDLADDVFSSGSSSKPLQTDGHVENAVKNGDSKVPEEINEIPVSPPAPGSIGTGKNTVRRRETAKKYPKVPEIPVKTVEVVIEPSFKSTVVEELNYKSLEPTDGRAFDEIRNFLGMASPPSADFQNDESLSHSLSGRQSGEAIDRLKFFLSTI